MKKTIWANTIVKNEERFIWFALMSVIDFVDKILVWDTGSTDNTVKIIKEIQGVKKNKIEFKQTGSVDKNSFTKARQKMLEETKSDWLFILDGDEVWWKDSINKVTETIQKKGDDLDLIVTPFVSVIGDIYHFQDEKAGRYNLAGKRGHLNIRAINRKIPGLYVDRPYGSEGYFDENGRSIQDRNKERILYLDKLYLHLSNIKRSNLDYGDSAVMQRNRKIRHELGLKFGKNFKYPEVFYTDLPDIVPDPWKKMSTVFKLRALLETPLRSIKRKFND
ncbi:hypothetical protein A3F00_02955 [Candidatus Daviesbacteria bacterium RIFCSPHIGHO2_12_FULL_37_11]|uniref:Glycosyltransferase 2-like domain-containing protein n=1 Tax=Candidatus Daviesbacteria bacterium RIFCSPHIGHO2_12_FULL_37_11 TaxID=1797777 RepID=A0A1F5KBJ0_9BACT|nr:MAG: hypothetical protein A2769_04245 [Candidatus Daviesbacteria bacterium RIFCSPHIGHO2_01_FULL_37_27]OGE38259.1 MAG: hypothetical protein A3F00_02955 [Candidatus Daviesbacteria bacterium RIFCSPHIGHO2_12_FULL_37_11]OGE46216.1 MAG: hypothetical protein A3B39_02720 [Candidatus Daviesbacteria bacterium RIFCSPLOWO2_01_FULL_37_10]